MGSIEPKFASCYLSLPVAVPLWLGSPRGLGGAVCPGCYAQNPKTGFIRAWLMACCCHFGSRDKEEGEGAAEGEGEGDGERGVRVVGEGEGEGVGERQGEGEGEREGVETRGGGEGKPSRAPAARGLPAACSCGTPWPSGPSMTSPALWTPLCHPRPHCPHSPTHGGPFRDCTPCWGLLRKCELCWGPLRDCEWYGRAIRDGEQCGGYSGSLDPRRRHSVEGTPQNARGSYSGPVKPTGRGSVSFGRGTTSLAATLSAAMQASEGQGAGGREGEGGGVGGSEGGLGAGVGGAGFAGGSSRRVSGRRALSRQNSTALAVVSPFPCSQPCPSPATISTPTKQRDEAIPRAKPLLLRVFFFFFFWLCYTVGKDPEQRGEGGGEVGWDGAREEAPPLLKLGLSLVS